MFFFGISFGDTYLEPADYSEYDVIVFDEIYFSSRNTYWRIKQFVEENKGKKILLLPVTLSNSNQFKNWLIPKTMKNTQMILLMIFLHIILIWTYARDCINKKIETS